MCFFQRDSILCGGGKVDGATPMYCFIMIDPFTTVYITNRTPKWSTLIFWDPETPFGRLTRAGGWTRPRPTSNDLATTLGGDKHLGGGGGPCLVSIMYFYMCIEIPWGSKDHSINSQVLQFYLYFSRDLFHCWTIF